MNTCKVESCNGAIHTKKSGLCQSHYNKLNYYGYIPEDAAPSPCKRCGAPTPTAGRSGPAPQYCTKDCQREVQRAYQRDKARAQREAERATRTPRTCGWCTEPLPRDAHGRTRYHAHCAKAYSATYAKDSTTRQCTSPDCDRPVRARSMCSMHWKRWARAEGLMKPDVWDDRRKNNYHIRRARKHGTSKGEVITIEALMLRDNNTCNICDGHIDPDLAYPSPMSKSMDHVVALSRGGEHTLANTAASHLICNIRKNDKDIDEVRAAG